MNDVVPYLVYRARELFALAVIALPLFVLVPVVTAQADPQCVIGTEQDFLTQVKPLGAAIHNASDKALKLVLADLNSERAKTQLFALEAVKMIVGTYKVGDVWKEGYALFDANSCIVPGGTKSMLDSDFANWMIKLGVLPSDFS